MTGTPWYHWPVAIVALAWTAVGAADYTLTQYEIAFYTNQFTPDQIAYFQALPVWVDALWALGVWAGLLGAILMLVRSPSSALVLGIAVLALAIAEVWMLTMTDPTLMALAGGPAVTIMLVTLAVLFFIYLYARQMHVEGVL